MMNNRIRLCVFDLGGTIVDEYSLSPFISLKQAFKRKRINVNNNLIYKDMGMNKHEHIEEILKDKYIREFGLNYMVNILIKTLLCQYMMNLLNIKWMMG